MSVRGDDAASRWRTYSVPVRPEDADVWDRVEQLLAMRAIDGDALSAMLTSTLRSHLSRQGKLDTGETFDRIEVEINDEGTGLIYRKAFQGRWVIPPDRPYVLGRSRFYAVARTRRSQIAFFHFGEGPDELKVYESLDRAAQDLPAKLVAVAAKALANRAPYVEELDI